MPPQNLPLEVRRNIFIRVEDKGKKLAKSIPEVFSAIAPSFFRKISIGSTKTLKPEEKEQTELARIYPDSGKYVESLTIVTDAPYFHTIVPFLKNFPPTPKLKHVRLVYSTSTLGIASLYYIGYESLLITIFQHSPYLSRLSFVNTLPSRSLINACIDKLTRLDIGYIPGYPNVNNIPFQIPIPPLLEIFSITPQAASYFTGVPPPTLTVIIVNSDDDQRDHGIPYACREFISRCKNVTSLAVVEEAPMSLTFIRLLNDLPPHIHNVCYRFKLDMCSMYRIGQIGDLLEPNECHFRLFTVIIPKTLPEDGDMLTTLKDHTQDLLGIFKLDGCAFAFRGGGSIIQGNCEGEMNQWVDILDDEVVDL